MAAVPTSLGVIVLRVQTLDEQDEDGRGMLALEDPVQRATVARDAVLDTVVYPSRDKAREITDSFPGLWVRIFEAKDALSMGEAEKLRGKA